MKTKIAALLAFVITAGVCSYIVVQNTPTTVVTEPSTKKMFSDYPMNFELRNNSLINKTKDVTLLITHKVTFDSTKNVYRYYYRLDYMWDRSPLPLGRPIIEYVVTWETLNKIAGKNILIEMDSGRVHEFNFESPNPPVFSKGAFTTFEEKDMPNGGHQWFAVPELTGVQEGPVPSE